MTASASDRLTAPQRLSLPVPPAPPAKTPAKPSSAARAPVTAAVHPSFFAGEAALSNGVYYLALPNGNPFGYYSYLPDPNYIYHFDLGYEYIVDANDGNGGLYLYDFASSHWWYTGRNYPFPYIYDFSRQAFLYYYPDTNNAGHYTTNPRYFYDFSADHILTMPSSIVLSADPLYLSGTDQPCTTVAPAPGAASATACLPVVGGAGGGPAAVQENFNQAGGTSAPTPSRPPITASRAQCSMGNPAPIRSRRARCSSRRTPSDRP